MRFSYSLKLSPPGMIFSISVYSPDRERVEKAKAKIDTGADISVIPLLLAEKLRLRPFDVVEVKGAFDDDFRSEPLYAVIFGLGEDIIYPGKVICSSRDNILLGRDVLNQLVLHADGPGRVFTLERP